MTTTVNYAATVPTRYIEVGGRSFAFRRFGQGGGIPLVGFQHFTGTLDNWDPVIVNGLARDREVILFDNAGVGNSGGSTPDKVAAMAEDAMAFLHALGLTKIDVLGFSLGGFIAQHLAYYYPELIRKLIMVGTAPQGVPVLAGFNELINEGMQKDAAERFLFIFFTPSAVSREKGKATLQRLMERKEDRDGVASPLAIEAQTKAIMAWGSDPVTIDLSKVVHPVLVVQGSDDVMMNADNSYLLFKGLPNAVLTFYPDSAHGSFFQYPELFVAQANDFLNKF